jgi:hypothetical protein
MHMPTILAHAETRSVAIDANPSEVFAFVSDPHNLPRWAPRFASAVRPSGEHWVVSSGASELTIDVSTDSRRGTVDLLGGPKFDRGAFTRVLPNGRGSEFMFTLFFPPDADPQAVADQMEVVETELRSVRELVQTAPS